MSSSQANQHLTNIPTGSLSLFSKLSWEREGPLASIPLPSQAMQLCTYMLAVPSAPAEACIL